MVDREQYWNRLTEVMKWLGTTPNRFASILGMERAESLYHIRNGEFGISPEFADRIVKYFPEISRAWLLSGVGNMLEAETDTGANIPYYNDDVAKILPTLSKAKASGYANIPFVRKCDIIANATKMGDDGKEHLVQLFLHYVDISQIRENNEYVFETEQGVLWCRIDRIERNKLHLTDLRTNKKQVVDNTTTRQVWFVIANLEINNH